MVAALGGLLFGFDTAVIAGATGALTGAYHLSSELLGFTVASALWGTIVGSIFAGFPGDRYGRRDSLRGMAILYVISALGCALAWNWSALVLFRFVGGLGIGGSSVLGPMYIAEVSPANWRGRLVGFFQVNVVVGILLAYLSNYLIGRADLGAVEWRWKLGVSAIPAVLFFLMLFRIPRSPRWLVANQRITEARNVLTLIGEERVEQEPEDIIASIHIEHGHAHESLFSRKYRLLVFLAIAIGFFNQLLGVNAILYYLNHIFSLAGFSKVSSDLQAVAIGATNLAATILPMSLIDKAGRRTLLPIGSVGAAFCLAGVAWIFATSTHQRALVSLLIGFIGAFSFSQGAVIWVYISEIFPNRVRAKGQSLGSFSHWFMNAIVSQIFPMLAALSHAAPFVFFACMAVLHLFVVLFFFPETRAVSLEDMQRKLGIT